MPTPWYRQFWPWFLIALPGSVVIAGLTTWGIAARHADDLVADDYYKSGLTINRDLAMLEEARSLGLTADFSIADGTVTVALRGPVTPPALRLALAHPLEADRDREVRLARTGPGLYQGELRLPAGQRWLWDLEPLPVRDEGAWRLSGEFSP